MTGADDDAKAQLQLVFEAAYGRTVLASRHVSYPFNVTAPLRPLGPRARVTVQSVSGGLFGGESLRQDIDVRCLADVEVRMPSATVVHAARNGVAATQTIRLVVGPYATLQYLPRPLILMPASAVAQTTDIVVDEKATVLLRDAFFAHDPEPPSCVGRSLSSVVRVRDGGGRLLAVDRMTFAANDLDGTVPGITAHFRAFGSVWLAQRMAPERCCLIKELVGSILARQEGCYGSATALRDGAGSVTRIAARDGGSLAVALDAITAALAAFLDITARRSAIKQPATSAE